MRRLLHIVIAIVLLLSIPAFGHAKEEKEDIRLAVRILKGLDDSRDKVWAFETLRRAAENDSLASAMNALGVAFIQGAGMERNVKMAIHWFEQAGIHGYHEAYHNLGMMYKSVSAGMLQDFIMASHYFKTGAEKGSPVCAYDYGYMLYKGLGCQQDYAEAVKLFQNGANYDYSPSLYMLGLCYRNGYGVERDDERASFFLKRAAMQSYTDAMQELARPQAENSWEIQYPEYAQQLESPVTMPDYDATLLPSADLTGDYHGMIATYDWSGQHIINERPLSISVQHIDSILQCRWCEGSDTVFTRAYINQEGRLVFSEGTISKQERYIEGHPVLYRFEDADIGVENGIVAGRLRLYSLAQREPERPMYITLRKAAGTGQEHESDAFNSIFAYPNPFAQQVTLSFELSEDMPQAKALIYSQSGINVANYSLGNLSAGHHAISLRPAIPDGMYVLYVVAGKQRLQTIIVKRRGAK
ncbi:MAG: SEL1-like repeat protein [Prevotella sp.]|nr:SEL1-like repeat protein [Prevotella sp.]